MKLLVITDIYISYPWWTIIFVVLSGLIYAGLLYIRNPLNKLSASISVFLFILRFSVVAFLAFLLLSPYIKTKNKQLEKPIVIIGHDNSSSILKTKDSVYYVNEFAESVKSFALELSEDLDVDQFLFGDFVRESDNQDFLDNTSNYSDFFSHVKQNYSGLNVGAIVLIGDGIMNNGIDPVYAASDIVTPVFTVALGDSFRMRDIKINDIRHNSIVYTGDIFPVEISINAHMLDGLKTSVKLKQDNRIIQEKRLTVSGNTFNKTVVFNIQATGNGKKRYSIVVDGAENEQIVENNSRDIFINILDNRSKILILAFAPHPDVGAIKQSIIVNQNLEVDIAYVSDNVADIDNYDMFILYQVPSKANTMSRMMKSIDESGKPILFVLGKQSRLAIFSRYFKGMDISSAVGSMADAGFEPANSFPLFTFDRELSNQLSTFPPLLVPLGNYQLSSTTQVFGWQNIANVITNFPLIAFYNDLGEKRAVITGEGIWQWRMQNIVQYNNADAVDALLNKSLMYLLADVDKRRFKVLTKGEYINADNVLLTAELFNQSLEPDNTSDVTLVMTNENNEKFNFIFSPYENYYLLDLNRLPVGVYSYKASAVLGNENFTDAGEFVVSRSNIESNYLNADHRMLSRLAQDHDGTMYYPQQIEELKSTIVNLDSLKTKVHYQDKYTGIRSIVFILIGLIFLLCLEWFLRKYFGNY